MENLWHVSNSLNHKPASLTLATDQLLQSRDSQKILIKADVKRIKKHTTLKFHVLNNLTKVYHN